MKKIFALVLIFSVALVGINAQKVNNSNLTGLLGAGNDVQKIDNSFWGCTFGTTANNVYESLKGLGLEPIPTEDCIYLKNNEIYGIAYATIGMKFTSEDAFYNIFGYNKFENKKEAEAAFMDNLSALSKQYPMQQMNKVPGCLKLYAFADGDADEAFSIGLYKNDSGVFFVRLNIINNYLLKRSKK